MSKPRIIKAGKDPDCVHHEYIDSSMIGTCRKCGQVKNYGRFMADDIDPVMKVTHGDATLEQVQESRSKRGSAGKKRKNALRGSANENSAAWVRIKRPPSTLPPVLIKGVDF